MSTRTVPAAELHLGDLVLVTPTGPVRRVTLHRLQGAPPVVVLAYAGQPGHRSMPADQPLTVLTAPPAREH
ncbi:MAG TPA: hypothetical protein VIC62_01315 [Nakamurella sp.]